LQDPTIINIEAMKELELIGLKVRMQTLQDWTYACLIGH
jgi:hypothetical protein